jgi:hypothetical protein
MINKKYIPKTIPNVFVNRSLKEMSLDAVPNPNADSIPINYKLNSQGYRCDEFNNQKILTLGCSHTEGHGMPIELTWPYLISKKINKDYINLAKGGDGMQAQIIKAFQFFKEFYHPEYIFAVFPIARIEIPLINFTTINEGSGNRTESRENIGKAMLSNKLIEKFSKEPHIAENVLPEEFAIFYNILFLKIFIQYCESNNIKLLWTYSNDSTLAPYSFKDFTDTYFESPYLNQKIPKKIGCHSEFADNRFFENAADYKYWPPGHWGLHQQIHIAESIYNML